MYEGEFSDDWTLCGKVSNGPRLNPPECLMSSILNILSYERNVIINLFKRVLLT